VAGTGSEDNFTGGLAFAHFADAAYALPHGERCGKIATIMIENKTMIPDSTLQSNITLAVTVAVTAELEYMNQAARSFTTVRRIIAITR
jgi:hypothetical protein